MGKTETNLYRAIIDGTFEGDLIVDGKPVQGVLYPRFEETMYVDQSGVEKTSPRDLTVHPMASGAEVDPDGGTSMHDARGFFGFKNWRYFAVPEGTEYGECLFIRKSRRIRRNRQGLEAGHYQIEPRTRMTLEAYKGALDNLARAAVVRQVALANQREDAT